MTGNTAVTTNVTLGRFIPDHFAVSVNQNGKMLASYAATTGFNYSGQTIGYLPGSLPSLTITPMNADGVITQNYYSYFQKLTATGVTITPPTADSTQSGKGGTKTALTATMATGSLANAGSTMSYTMASSANWQTFSFR